MPASSKIVLIRQLVEAASNNLHTAMQLLKDLGAADIETKPAVKTAGGVQRTEGGAVIIEGVFDGQNMVGPDGKLYSVPANYASKSKLVEGDLLKLTISPDGSFIYKQIGPVERERLVGVLTKDEQTDEFRVLVQGRFYRVLLASVTYFKASVGDEVVVLVPKGTPSSWAAVENVIKKDESAATADKTLPDADASAPSKADASGSSSSLPTAETVEPAQSKPRGRPKKNADTIPTAQSSSASVSSESVSPQDAQLEI